MSKITIVTPSYNSAATIVDCLRSVQSQSVPVKHLVIDGGSTDDSVKIARTVSPGAHIISEPDDGVYDAMNKGITLADTEIVGILNADDMYFSDSVLEMVLGAFRDPEVESCYGDLIYVAPHDLNRTVRYWRSGTFKRRSFYWGWMPPHPTFFVRKRVYDRLGGFNTSLGSAADYELMLRFLLKHQIRTAYIPLVLVKMRTGGISNASMGNRVKANRMDRRAWKVNGLTPYPFTLQLKPLRKVPQFLFRKISG